MLVGPLNLVQVTRKYDGHTKASGNWQTALTSFAAATGGRSKWEILGVIQEERRAILC